jgi:hypothetical protein
VSVGTGVSRDWCQQGLVSTGTGVNRDWYRQGLVSTGTGVKGNRQACPTI